MEIEKRHWEGRTEGSSKRDKASRKLYSNEPRVNEEGGVISVAKIMWDFTTTIMFH